VRSEALKSRDLPSRAWVLEEVLQLRSGNLRRCWQFEGVG
jgi:hypothetical protein